MSMSMRRAFAADIGGSFMRIALVGTDGAIEAEHRLPTPVDDRAALIAALAGFCRMHDPDRVLPLGLSLACVVEPGGAAISANIRCVNGWQIEAGLRAALGRAVALANDADCFALGEAMYGAGQGAPVVFGAILGSGVGGGLVVGGRLVAGAGEWGHGPVVPPVAPDTPGALPCLPCGCGLQGCLDTIGGAHGLVRLDRALHGRDRSSQSILACWSTGEPEATQTVDLHVATIGGFLAMVVNTLGASVVPVGGGLGNDRCYVAALDRAVRARILRRLDKPLLVPTALSERAALLGAAHLAAQAAG